MPRQRKSTRRISSCRKPERQQKSADYRDIGQVENRPPPEVDEIDDVATPQYVEQVSRCSAERRAETEHSGVTLQTVARSMQHDSRYQCCQPDEDQRESRGVARVHIPHAARMAYAQDVAQ